MAMNYDLSALELLQILGCEPAADYEADERLPKLLNDFLSRICENPLFETADIWQDGMAYFSYESIAETIEDNNKYWTEHPEARAESWTDAFSRLPQSEWPTLVPNYLTIGSDYAAGIVEFAILEADLGQENPPVYMHHEADDERTWKRFSDTLSGFLMYILCAVLSCETYETAQEVLEDEGWDYAECDKPETIGRQYDFIQGLSVACGYDAETNTILSVLEDNECKAFLISRE